MMLRLRNSFTAFFLVAVCLVELCLLNVSSEESPPKEDKCKTQNNKSCDDCVKVDGCAYCEKTKECLTFDLVKDTLHKACEGQDWKYKQCFVSGKILLIALPVAGFVVLVALGCTIYCCCCRRKKARGPSKEEAKWRRQREEIEVKHKERREERQKKHDEIRKKYGLFRKGDSEEGDDVRYHQFENA